MQVTIHEQNIWLNLHHVYHFYIVAKEGSLSKASKTLKIGQPTLSSQLKVLEQTLQVELLSTVIKNKFYHRKESSYMIMLAKSLIPLNGWLRI